MDVCKRDMRATGIDIETWEDVATIMNVGYAIYTEAWCQERIETCSKERKQHGQIGGDLFHVNSLQSRLSLPSGTKQT